MIRSLAAAIILAVALPAPSAAQTRLHLVTGTPGCSGSACEPGRLLTIDVDRRIVAGNRPAHAPPNFPGPLAITGDGEYVVWTGLELLSPTVTLSATSVTTGAQLAIMLRLSFSNVFTDRIAPRAFVSTPERDLLVVDANGTERIPLSCPVTAMVGAFDLTTMSGDRSRAFVNCPTSSPLGDTMVVDVASGTRIGTIAGSGSSRQATNYTGSELFTVRSVTGTSPTTSEIERFDVPSGAVLARRTLALADSNVSEIVHDGRSHRVFLGGASVVALDETTLDEVGRIPTPAAGLSPMLALDPDLPHLYTAWNTGSVGSARMIVQQVDTSTMTVLAQGELTIASRLMGIVVGPRAGAPRNLRSQVDGGTVHLDWMPDQDAALRTGFVVEAGTGPGLANLAAFSLGRDQTSLVVTGVPSGVYFVRVRTVNGSGAGAASEEIVVTVS